MPTPFDLIDFASGFSSSSLTHVDNNTVQTNGNGNVSFTWPGLQISPIYLFVTLLSPYSSGIFEQTLNVYDSLGFQLIGSNPSAINPNVDFATSSSTPPSGYSVSPAFPTPGGTTSIIVTLPLTLYGHDIVTLNLVTEPFSGFTYNLKVRSALTIPPSGPFWNRYANTAET
jgi:hypothetical protein